MDGGGPKAGTAARTKDRLNKPSSSRTQFHGCVHYVRYQIDISGRRCQWLFIRRQLNLVRRLVVLSQNRRGNCSTH